MTFDPIEFYSKELAHWTEKSEVQELEIQLWRDAFALMTGNAIFYAKTSIIASAEIIEELRPDTLGYAFTQLEAAYDKLHAKGTSDVEVAYYERRHAQIAKLRTAILGKDPQ